jgi:hypothetical protein
VETKLVRRKGAVHVAYVDSDTDPGKEYQIARLPSGALFCACPGCSFHHGTCKHLTAYEAAAGAATYRQRQRVVARKQVPVERVETFTFRRAMFIEESTP